MKLFRDVRPRLPGLNATVSSAFSLALALGLVLLSFSRSAAVAADWPQFLGPHRNGSTTGEGLATAWPKDGPRRVWTRDVGQGFAGPVAAGARVILFHRLEDREVVHALDAATGKDLWRAEYPTRYRDDFGFDEGPRSTPAMAGDRVFTYGAEGMLQATRLADGQRLWQVDTRALFGQGKGFFGMACSPLVESNAVVLQIGGRPDAGIVAFDRETGRVLWKATADEASYSSPVAATIAGRRWVLALTREALVGLRPADGQVGFRFPWRPSMEASVNAASPVVAGDLVFISVSYGTGAAVLRLGAAGTPEKVWAADDVLSNHYATSLHHEGFLYGFDGRQETGCRLRCVELKTGQVRWTEGGLPAGTVSLVDGQLMVLTERGELLQAPATPQGFRPVNRAQVLGFGVRAYPAFAGGRLYARSKDKLVCLDLKTPPLK